MEAAHLGDAAVGTAGPGACGRGACPASDHVQIRRRHRAPAGLAGPRILSDRTLRPGSLVHYRYGGFAAPSVFSDQGVFESWMTGPDGSRVRDERTAWFSAPPWAVSPFADAAPDAAPG